MYKFMENFIFGLIGIMIIFIGAVIIAICYIHPPIILVFIGVFVIIPLLGKLVIRLTGW
jgi:hypothetical protein